MGKELIMAGDDFAGWSLVNPFKRGIASNPLTRALHIARKTESPWSRYEFRSIELLDRALTSLLTAGIPTYRWYRKDRGPQRPTLITKATMKQAIAANVIGHRVGTGRGDGIADKGYAPGPKETSSGIGVDPMSMGWDLLSYFRKKKQASAPRSTTLATRPEGNGPKRTLDEKVYSDDVYRGLKRVQAIWPHLSSEEKTALLSQLDNPGPKGILPYFITTMMSIGQMKPSSGAGVYATWSTHDFVQSKPWVLTNEGLRRVRRGQETSPLPLGTMAGSAATAQKNVALALASKDPKKAATARQTCAVLATAARNGSDKAAAHLRSIRYYQQGMMSGVGDAFVGEDSIIGASLGAICGTSCYRKGL